MSQVSFVPSPSFEEYKERFKDQRTTRRLATQVVRRPWKQRIVNDLDGGFGIQMFAHLAKNKAYHTEGHVRSTVDYVRKGKRNNFDK